MASYERSANPNAAKNDLLRRLITVSIGAPIVLALLIHKTYSLWLIHLAHLVCTIEWLRLVPTTEKEPKSDIPSICYSFPILSLMIAASSKHAFVIFLISHGVLTVCKALTSSPQEIAAIDHIQHGTIFLSLGFHHLMHISRLSVLHSIYFIMIVWNCDTGALLGGRLGRRLVMTNPGSSDSDLIVSFLGIPDGWVRNLRILSPQKTFTGLLSGIALGTITAVYFPSAMCRFVSFSIECGILPETSALAPNILTFPKFLSQYSVITRRVFIGIVISSTGLLGDLVESCIKRRAGKKDAGKLIPGHGGFMDRMDSSLISGAVYFCCFM